MSQLYGVGLDIEVGRINNQFKMQIQKRGGIGIRSLGVIFRRMDNNGNRKLDQAEFTEALATYGIFPKIVEIQALMKYYDVDGDGNITYEEFIRGLRDPLTERRKNMVDKAFELIDRSGNGSISVEDINAIYDVSQNQDFIDGTKTREEILQEFLNGFDGMRGNNDGTVTRQEWTDYYTDLSMSTPSDEYFVRMMESVWNICEDETASVTAEQIKHLTKTMRAKLLDFSGGQTEEMVLRNTFREFDLNENGVLTADELQALLVRLQMSVERRYLTALLRKFDRNGNGVIEFDEFCNFLINDPYR